MTANKRIVLNVVASYGRSLFSLMCGIFTGRWLLLSLGEVDYGLFGVVGGIVSFIAFFNHLFSTSISRYYAYAVGAANVGGPDALEDCRVVQCAW